MSEPTLIDPFDTLTVIFYAIGTTVLAESNRD